MEDVYKLNPSNTVSFAKELTFKAIENRLISVPSDPKEAAIAVTNFYKQALETINPD